METKLCIITAYTPVSDWDVLGKLTSSTMQSYADKYGHDFKVFTEGFDDTRHPSWSKIKFIKQVLPDYDWVWWIDADAVIVNQSLTVDRFLKFTQDILIGKDKEGAYIFNCGSFFVRNCDWSLGLLDKIWQQDKWANESLWEQSALTDLYLNGETENRLALFNTRDFNGFVDWHAEKYGKTLTEEFQWHVGDFVAHCAGYDVKHRIAFLKEIVEKYTVR